MRWRRRDSSRPIRRTPAELLLDRREVLRGHLLVIRLGGGMALESKFGMTPDRNDELPATLRLKAARARERLRDGGASMRRARRVALELAAKWAGERAPHHRGSAMARALEASRRVEAAAGDEPRHS